MCILRHTHYYICVYKAIHIATFPPFTEKTEAVPERNPGGRKAETRLAVLLRPVYTHSAIHIKLVIMPGYIFHLCILSYTSFVFIVYMILYEFQRGYTEEQMGFLGTAGLVRAYCVY